VVLEVREPGLLTTIQDAGRSEWTHLGVPVSGACDPWSLAVASVMVDADPGAADPGAADPGAAAVEMTLVGPTVEVIETCVVAIAGADLGGTVRETGRRLLPGRVHRLEASTTIEFPGPVDLTTGARAYLAMAGGIAVPSVLGSASTCLSGGFGGLDGRALRLGDRLVSRAAAAEGRSDLAERVWSVPGGFDPAIDPGSVPVRLVEGPHLDLLDPSVMDELIAGPWTVEPASDRVGLRLSGPDLAGRDVGRASPPSWPELLSHGVVWGAVQLPPDGAPIVLLADHQTTGGYPVVAVAIAADRSRLGQLRPGSAVRFERTDLATAREELRRQRDLLAAGAAMLRDTARWDELWRSAGG
jgi:antagonist of KipI